eukprot:167436_1
MNTISTDRCMRFQYTIRLVSLDRLPDGEYQIICSCGDSSQETIPVKAVWEGPFKKSVARWDETMAMVVRCDDVTQDPEIPCTLTVNRQLLNDPVSGVPGGQPCLKHTECSLDLGKYLTRASLREKLSMPVGKSTLKICVTCRLMRTKAMSFSPINSVSKLEETNSEDEHIIKEENEKTDERISKLELQLLAANESLQAANLQIVSMQSRKSSAYNDMDEDRESLKLSNAKLQRQLAETKQELLKVTDELQALEEKYQKTESALSHISADLEYYTAVPLRDNRRSGDDADISDEESRTTSRDDGTLGKRVSFNPNVIQIDPSGWLSSHRSIDTQRPEEESKSKSYEESRQRSEAHQVFECSHAQPAHNPVRRTLSPSINSRMESVEVAARQCQMDAHISSARVSTLELELRLVQQKLQISEMMREAALSTQNASISAQECT